MNKLIFSFLSVVFICNLDASNASKIGANVRVGVGFAGYGFSHNGLKNNNISGDGYFFINKFVNKDKVIFENDADGSKKEKFFSQFKEPSIGRENTTRGDDNSSVYEEDAFPEVAIDIEHAINDEWYTGVGLGVIFLKNIDRKDLIVGGPVPEALSALGSKIDQKNFNKGLINTISADKNFDQDQMFDTKSYDLSKDKEEQKNQYKQAYCGRMSALQQTISVEGNYSDKLADLWEKQIEESNTFSRTVQIKTSGNCYFAGPFVGKRFGKFNAVVGCNLTFRKLTIEATIKGGLTDKVETDVALGIMPTIRGEYFFTERVGAYVQFAYNYALSNETKRDVSDSDAYYAVQGIKMRPMWTKIQLDNFVTLSAGIVGKIY